MRISDWSSDVCSSDLLIKAMKNVAKLVDDPRLKQKLKDTTGIGPEETRACIRPGLLDRGYLVRQGKALAATPAAFSMIDAVPRPDRQSVGSGKMVSERVGPGGPRILKKKKH